MKNKLSRMIPMFLVLLSLGVMAFVVLPVQAAASADSPPTGITVEFTPEVIAAIVGLFLTLVFAYFPKLRVLYGGLQSEIKSLIMLVLLLITAVVIMVLSKYGIIATNEPVTWVLFAKVMFAALIANQPAYTLLPKAADVTAAKLAR